MNFQELNPKQKEAVKKFVESCIRYEVESTDLWSIEVGDNGEPELYDWSKEGDHFAVTDAICFKCNETFHPEFVIQHVMEEHPEVINE